jgi:hypothetical protein
MAEIADISRLRDLFRDVADALDVAPPTDDDDEFGLEFPFEEGTSKMVNAFVDDDDGEAWVMIYSVFGKVEDLDPVNLLERNFSPGYTFIAVDQGDAMVCASYPLDDLDAESLEALLGDVASWADALESEEDEEEEE